MSENNKKGYTENGALMDIYGKLDNLDYADLTNQPDIPAKISDLEDDSEFVTETELVTVLEAYTEIGHTQQISSITGLETALTSIIDEINSLKAWKNALKIDKLEAFPYTTIDATGNFTVDTSVAFTNPVALVDAIAPGGAEGYHCHIISVDGTTITGRAFKNKTQPMVLAGTMDPDNPVAQGTTLNIVVFDRRV